MLSILGFLLILGPLVVLHELGHYTFARIFGVKAEIFSIGFGPRLFAKQIGETEWRVSLIPLGGYVKLLGEDRESELTPDTAKRALHKQAPWKRFFIFFGGPLFNFLGAIAIFMAILAIGEPQIASTIGRVVENSPAQKAGFQSGDQILSVSGKPVRKFEEVLTVINDNPGKALEFDVLHARSQSHTLITATPVEEDGFSVYGEATHVGEIDGLFPTARSTLIGVSDPASGAAKVGLATGDLISSFNGKPVVSWEELESVYGEVPLHSPIRLKAHKGKTGPESEVILMKSAPTMAEAWGLYSSELFVERPVDKSPAQAAGLKTGDRLLGVAAQPVRSFFELKDAVQHAGEKDGRVDLRWERDGKAMAASLTPTATTTRDPLLKKTTQFTVGVMPMMSLAEPVTILERTINPFTLLYKGTERMIVFSWRNLVSIRKMFSGDVSVATLGGPIMIGKIAGESIARGLIAFLTTMAMLSIGLGVLNILPVPVLDGGHLLLLVVESVRGRPLSMRQMEIIQGGGLCAILLLMGIVIKNDITRLPFLN